MEPKEVKSLDDAALEYARNHSKAPDKETPDWIITDFKAGAAYADQVNAELKKDLDELQMKYVDRGIHVRRLESDIHNLQSENAELKKENETWKSTYEALAKVNDNTDKIQLQAENTRLREALDDIQRFLPSLRACVDTDFVFPDRCLEALDKIEQALNPQQS